MPVTPRTWTDFLPWTGGGTAGDRRARLGVWLRSSSTGLLLVAVLIGIGAAAFAVIFRWLINTFTTILTGYPDYALVAGQASPHWPALGRWFVLLTPVIAGLVYGPLVYFFAREARGHGVPEVMYAVARAGGRIRPQVAAVKALASALTIGGGGSVGREGPIVQIGSAIGSTIGRIIKAPEGRMRLFVACGAAGGIAATFNAPLAGVFFALELILVDFGTGAFGMVVLSAVTSSAIGRAAFGDVPFLRLPKFGVRHPYEYLFYILLGVLAAAVGVGFTRVLYWFEDAADAVWRGPEWARPAVGGLLLGLVLLALPQMYGVGYPVLGRAVSGGYAIGFLLILLVGKMIATSLTIAIGGSGGVFAPSLFIGAMLGAAFGDVINTVLPSLASPIGAYGLIGMGAVFAGAARAPITAVLIMFELTGEYTIILPLMASIVIATAVGNRITRDTIYTLKLRRRGVDLSAPDEANPAQRIPVSAAMTALPVPVLASEALPQVAARLTRTQHGVLPVSSPDGEFLGILTARAVAEAMAGGHEDTEKAAIITELPARVRQGDSLAEALEALTLAAAGAIPVFADEGGDREPVGWVTYSGVYQALQLAPQVAARPR